MDAKVQLEDHPGGNYAVRHFTARQEQFAELMGPAFGAVMQYLAAHGSYPAGAPICYYEMVGDAFEVWTGFPVNEPVAGDDQVEAFSLPPQRVATMIHTGPYATLPAAYDAFFVGAQELGVQIEMGSPMWEEYLDDPQVNPEQTRTKICWPC